MNNQIQGTCAGTSQETQGAYPRLSTASEATPKTASSKRRALEPCKDKGCDIGRNRGPKAQAPPTARQFIEAFRPLLAQPHRIELVVEIVAGRDGPAAHLGEVRDDAVPLEGHDEVYFLVVEALLEGAQELPPLIGIRGAGLLQVQLVHHRVLVPAEVHG